MKMSIAAAKVEPVTVDPDDRITSSFTVRLPPPARTFLTVRQTAQRFPVFTEPALRSLIFNAKSVSTPKGARSNGFDSVIVRVPGQRKILISEERLIDWIYSNEAK